MNDAFPASVEISVLAAILSEGDNKLSLILRGNTTPVTLKW